MTARNINPLPMPSMHTHHHHHAAAPSRRKKKGTTQKRIQQGMICITVVSLVTLAWLSKTALPSSSHTTNKDLDMIARLQDFASRRNLSMNNSQTSAASKKNTTEPKKTLRKASNDRTKDEPKREPETTKKTATEPTETTPKKIEVSTDKVKEATDNLNDTSPSRLTKQPPKKEGQHFPPKRVFGDAKTAAVRTNLDSTQAFAAKNMHVQVLKRGRCTNKAKRGDVLKIKYAARANAETGGLYATSNSPTRIRLGKNDLIPKLDQALISSCPGERRRVVIPYQIAHDENTDKRFKIKGGANVVYWTVDILAVGGESGAQDDDDDEDETVPEDDDDEAPYEEDDEDDDPEKMRDNEPLSAEEKWKNAVGLVETVEEEYEVEEDRVVETNVTSVANGTNATDGIDAANGANVATPTVIKVKAKKKRMVKRPIASLEAPSNPTQVPFHPAIPYLGVLVDGGRHYFPPEWLKKLVDELYLLRFNFIHLRLTDDQAFNVRLKSHPDLALPAPATAEDKQNSNPVWTPEELKDLVNYAEAKNITIMPEINAPGHCASWGGIEGLIIPCPAFSCEKGYGVPLNETNPKLLQILKDVIKEVTEIFHTSPYLHLGGDEVHMSKACYEEINEYMPNYNDFETGLKKVLKELKLSEDYIVRWETTGQKGIDVRAGNMTQWWESFPHGKRKLGEFFVSQGLYFDSCGDRDGPEFFNHCQKLVREDPKGIIAGTFELSTQWWKDRNVFGRLLAVAMGSSKEGQDMDWSSEMYTYFCRSLGWSDDTCLNDGRPLIPTHQYLQKWKKHWTVWKAATCDRLTEPYDVRVMNELWTDGMSGPLSSSPEVERSVDPFWENFGDVPRRPLVNSTVREESSLFHTAVPHLGATLDISIINDLNTTKEIVDVLSTLGFNLIHLRVLDDSTFPLELTSHPKIAWDGSVQERRNRRRTWENVIAMSKDNITRSFRVKEIVKYAGERGVKVMPEISIASRAGGWFSSGMVAQCPNVMCDTDNGIPLDINYPSVLSVLSNVIYELRALFSSEYLHLGYDERKESSACFDELEISADFDSFEKKLMTMLQLQGISPEHVLRWESSDDEEKKHRAGNVTHYHTLMKPPSNEEEQSFFSSWMGGSKQGDPFFVSTGLNFDAEMEDKNQTTDAWTIYKHTRRLVKAKPTGILAQYLLSKDEAMVGRNNAIGKMIAVAIGASNLPKMNKEKFREVYMKACGDHLNQKSCSLFGQSPVSSSLMVLDQRLLTSKCQSLTHVETYRRMKEGVR